MIMQRRVLGILAAASLCLALLGCSSDKKDERIVLGFSQIGAESEWRTANTESIKSAAATMNIDLRFADAQQKQENQIKAIRSFIAQKVDVIAFSPVVETGWDTVLREAKAANIPVILTDRSVTADPVSVCGLHRFGLRGGRTQGRPLGGRALQGHGQRRAHRRTAGHGRCRPGHRSQERLRGNHRRASAPEDHPFAIRRLHALQGQGSDGGVPQGRAAQDQRALRAQRRHGDRRDPGHRGSGPEARAATSSSSPSTR